MSHYDVVERTSTTGTGKKKWFIIRKKGGRFNTTKEAQREANRLNRKRPK